MTSTYAPNCTGSDNPAFIDLDSATASEINRARSLCASCPIRVPCALYALTSGTTPDGYASPAVDVMMGGVACTGSYQSRTSLYRVIGAKEPKPKPKPKRRTIQPGTPCASCGRPLHSWTRTPEEIPAGHVMHYSRGYCTHCRPALQREVMRHIPKDERRGAAWSAPNRANTTGREYAQARREKLAVLMEAAVRHGGVVQDMVTCSSLATELGRGTDTVIRWAEKLDVFVVVDGVRYCYAPLVRRELEEVERRKHFLSCAAVAKECEEPKMLVIEVAKEHGVLVYKHNRPYCDAEVVRRELEAGRGDRLAALALEAHKRGGSLQDMMTCSALAEELGRRESTVVKRAEKLGVLVTVGYRDYCHAPTVRRALAT